jgi:uncharacterized protein with von Willebrand factor type A (vWA) domain
MEMKATDLSARLLATENLSVVRGRVRTASFDIKSRVLTLPMWKEMTPEIEDMLVGHEVGHALYTGEKYMEPIQENPKMMSYLNVLEDVRIEKLIKRKYPGLRKRMNEGYKQLNDRDFFGVKTVPNLEDLLLIDKINLYFKAGFQCGVQFTPDEKVFITRAERTETVEDVIQLAHEVYAYSKEQAEERKQRMKQENPGDQEEEQEFDEDFDPDLSGEFDEEDFDEDFDNPYTKTPTSKQNDERAEENEDLESKTERAFRNKLDDLADESTEYTYWKFNPSYLDNIVIGYKTILAETKENWEDRSEDYRFRYMSDEEYTEYCETLSKNFTEFKTDSMRTVNYLVKEFEMRKSAKLYKRAQVSKIGSLDMRKVYAYQLQDDLFKRVTTVPQGKNHGMIMLVDWSGSMSDVIQDTLKQVINLAMFCNRVQIPYRVLAFTSDYRSQKVTYEEQVEISQKRREVLKGLIASGEKYLDSADQFNLLELFSNRMTTSEFNSMAKRLLDWRFFSNLGYSLSGTPLNEALVWAYHNIGSYIKNNQIEKMTFITLTDGEGGSIPTLTGGRLDDYRTDTINNQWKRIRTKHFIRDEKTQKTYEFTRDSSQQASTILQMIKDRYDVSLIGFHICQNRRGDLNQFLHSALHSFTGDATSVIETWRRDFKTQGFASIKNTGRDELFLIPQSSTKIVEGELEVNADANAKSIARNFSKYLNVKKTSRVLLNRFVGLVA